MKKKEKNSYEAPMLEISLLFDGDIVTTSTPDWDSGNVDSGGWT